MCGPIIEMLRENIEHKGDDRILDEIHEDLSHDEQTIISILERSQEGLIWRVLCKKQGICGVIRPRKVQKLLRKLKDEGFVDYRADLTDVRRKIWRIK